MNFYERVDALCSEKGISADRLCKELGLSNATATKWRKGAEPRNSTKKAIADYFGVSLEYISGESEEKAPTTSRSECERELMEVFKTLDEQGQQTLIAVARQMRKQDEEAP